MRVLHIYKGDLYGGIESMLSTLANCRKLCPRMEPHFALCFQGRLSAQLADESVPVYDLGPVRGRKLLSVRRARLRVTEIIKVNRIDVVICHGVWSQALFGSLARRIGVTQIFWQHDLITRRSWMESVAAKSRPDSVISNSNYSRTNSCELYPDVPSQVLYCPVKPLDWRMVRDKREEVRRQMKTASDRCVIIQVSRFHSWKGHELHLKALARLRHLANWECWMVGGPQHRGELSYSKRIRALRRELGLTERVRFFGERDDVPTLLAASDIYCQPNTGPEAFGLAFVEALAAGLPVITTQMNAASEIVDDSCGILVEPDNPVQLADNLTYLIDNLEVRLQLGSGGPARAVQLCDAERQLSCLAEILTYASSRPNNAQTVMVCSAEQCPPL